MIAIIISMFTGSTDEGYKVNNFDIAIANTARTSHVRHITKHKNIILILLFITEDAILAIDWPFSFKLIVNAPKSWTAPISTVPNTTHKTAGNQPQKTAIQGPIIGAAPAIEVKWWPNKICFLVGT